MDEVDIAMRAALKHTNDIVLMQCNTNYTASLENFKYINLNVLNEYKNRFPNTILGLSDHTPGHATVLGAVSLGARVIEKHFTDDTSREGPDHKFSMDFSTWKDMVDRTRELEFALGSGNKRVEDNEKETVVIQRRSLRIKKNMSAGQKIFEKDIEALRPCPENAIEPYYIKKVNGKTLIKDIEAGDCIRWENIE